VPPITEYLKRVDAALRAGNATEHTHRPALKRLVEELRDSVVATNEPSRVECGSPDFIVTLGNVPLGYIEAKDVGLDLERIQDSEQLKRYRASLGNLILTDYLEFRLYRNGELVHTARLASVMKNGALRKHAEGASEVESLLFAFLDADVPTINNPRELAERMARSARLLYDLIHEVFASEGKKGDLHAQFDAFRKVLIGELKVEEFADMYAQTISYGLFAARCNHRGSGFTRDVAGRDLPKTNPFLRKLFNTIAGADLDDRIAWAVDDLAQLLARADMAAILEDFGRATRQEDPVVHFYETFLAAYNPKLRETRGVYYTPEPVVGFIVRSVDALLKRDFKLSDGLADKVKVKVSLEVPNGKAKKKKQFETHRVQILDPACGTGTFLHVIVNQIRERFRDKKGMWPSYVSEHLLPRLYGFELLMAPYAVAHMKLGLLLRETGYDFSTDERLRVFLTNSLEEAHELAGLPLFAQWLADESAAASEVKREVPIMVVIGNPPYSGHSANKGEWIESLMAEYKRSPELKKPAQAKWLSDDYVKFIRFAQWRIERTGYGVLGFITNHSWLDNPTFLDMRASLMATFDDLYLLDLHGNNKKKEVAPDGIDDKNVFDIQQGVAIGLFVKRSIAGAGAQEIHHADLWGPRPSKYAWLAEHDVTTTKWKRFTPSAPKRLFVPQDEDLLAEYERGKSVVEAMDQNGEPAPGIVTTHDEFAISWTRDEAIAKVERFLATNSEDEARQIWRLCKQDQWNYKRAKQELASGDWREHVVPILYRPFDVRWTVYDRNVTVHRRERVMGHLLTPNRALVLPQQTKDNWSVLVASHVVGHKAASRYDISSVIPLELRSTSVEAGSLDLGIGQQFNFAPGLLSEWSSLLGRAVTAEEIFAYFYAVMYAPSYRERYAMFLKRDFPRVPFTSDRHVFEQLSRLGHELVELHLMRTFGAHEPGFPIAGSNRVEQVERRDQRVYINPNQYFDRIPNVIWEYDIGGYQVAHRWLKDRKGCLLSFDDLTHYRRVIAALAETSRIQMEIERAIPGWPLA